MGTNFYLKTPKGETCAHCGRFDFAEELHIGKSSAGWCFSLHVMPEEGINTLEDWKQRFSTGVIVDEYGETHTPDEILDRITKRSHPMGLARHQIGAHCIGHGEGTWDYIPGEFS